MNVNLTPECFARVERTASRLAVMFAELRSGTIHSAVVGIDLSEFECFGQTRRLMLFLCDTESLTLWSSFSHFWMVDEAGFRQIADWNLFRPYLGDAELSAESPYIKFAVVNGRIRFGLRLGTNQYVSLEGDLDADGSPIVASLCDPYPTRNIYVSSDGSCQDESPEVPGGGQTLSGSAWLFVVITAVGCLLLFRLSQLFK